MRYPGTQVSVTGATGFIGAHVAKLLAERGAEVRVTHRDPARLERLADVKVQPVQADVLDRGALRRAFRGAKVVFHAAGFVGTHPGREVWEVNALGPRLAVEAAAAEGVERVVVTSSVGGIGPAPAGEVGSEEDVFRSPALTYVDSKHEGESEALAAGARHGIDVVIVNPAYVLGVPVDRSQPGETSTRMVGNYIRGRVPAVVDGSTNIVHVEDVALGHLLAAERGAAGQRYVLGGQNIGWVDLMEEVASLAKVRHPLLVIPVEVAEVLGSVGVGGVISPQAFSLMAQNWRFSSKKAIKELGYKPRGLPETLRETVDWYLELLHDGVLAGGGLSPMALGSLGLQVAGRTGGLRVLKLVEGWTGRRLLAGG